MDAGRPPIYKTLKRVSDLSTVLGRPQNCRKVARLLSDFSLELAPRPPKSGETCLEGRSHRRNLSF
jgi:hypothetical protein